MGKIYYFSHSRTDADSRCPRERYLGSEWGGTGLEPLQAGWDLSFGNVIHKYLEVLAEDQTLDCTLARTEVLAKGTEVIGETAAKTYAALAEGMLRGFVKGIWPVLMKQYAIVETEKLRAWEVEEGQIFRFKQDILLRDRATAELVYPDYKTTSSNSPEWMASWRKSPQLHSSMYAMKQLGIPITKSMVIGFYKGWKDRKTKLPTSIFCKGWVNREYAMSPQYSYVYQRGKGWEPFSTFDEFDDLSTWVANMPQDVLEEQFPITGPVFPREDIGAAYFRQQLYRQRAVAFALQGLELAAAGEGLSSDVDDLLDEYFPQDFNKCEPAYGFKCGMVPLCWQGWVEKDPLGSGLFQRRSKQYEDGAEPDTPV